MLCEASLRALIPFMGAPPSCPNYLPKASPPHSITLGVKIPAHELGGGGDDTNVRSITGGMNEPPAVTSGQS